MITLDDVSSKRKEVGKKIPPLMTMGDFDAVADILAKGGWSIKRGEEEGEIRIYRRTENKRGSVSIDSSHDGYLGLGIWGNYNEYMLTEIITYLTEAGEAFDEVYAGHKKEGLVWQGG